MEPKTKKLYDSWNNFTGPHQTPYLPNFKNDFPHYNPIIELKRLQNQTPSREAILGFYAKTVLFLEGKSVSQTFLGDLHNLFVLCQYNVLDRNKIQEIFSRLLRYMETHTFTEEYRSPVNTNFNQEINSSNQQLKPNENPYHQFANTVGKPPQSNSKIIPTSQIMTNSNKLKINLNQDKTLTKPNPTEEMGPAKSSNYGNINKAIISNSESRPRSPPNSTKPPNGGRSSTPTINGNGTVIISTNENFQRYPVILNRHDDYVGNPRTMNAKQSKTISQTKQMPNISYTKTNTFPQTNSKKVKKPQNENNRLLLQKLNAQINGIYDQRKAEEIIELFDNFICKPNDTNSYNRICLVLRNRKSIPFQIIVQMKDLVLNYFK